MRRTLPALAVLAAVATACGGGDGPTGPQGPNGPTNGTFSARIDGTNWSATIVTPAMNQVGQISALGASSPTWTMAFAWVDNGPATYVVGQSIGFNGNLSQGTGVWSASAGIGSGTLTITTRTASRVAGTFSFTMQPGQGSSSNQPVTITNGQFDITF